MTALSRHRFTLLVASAALLVVPGARVMAQLTLRDALAEAERAAFANRIAAGAARARQAQTLAPLKGIVPSLRIDAGYVRTTDPIGAFGSTMRQRSIDAADFDPQRLNYPAAVGNYQTDILLEQPLVNADAWLGRRAATHAADANQAAEDWTRVSTRVAVVRAYYGAVLAAERTITLQAAARAAHAHVAQAESMVREGLATKSDALLAAVRAGDVDAQLAEATGGAAIAREQLAVVLGRDALPAELLGAARLPSTARLREIVALDTIAVTPQPRADVRGAAEALDAARVDADRARAALLPRINAFARYDWNSAARLYGGDRNWTVGVMASWLPFAGPSEASDVRASSARAQAAQAESDAARANARLEIETTRTALSVALARLDIAERATGQSVEAHRIVSRKYDGGLATVVELLDAQAVETQSTLALSQARWATIFAAADRRRALGRDPASLAELDDGVAAVGAPGSASGHVSEVPRDR